MDNWKVKIVSKDCPYKIYPTSTIHSRWRKGYCSIFNKEHEKNVECRCENCPLRIRL